MNKVQRFALLNTVLTEEEKETRSLPYQNPSYKFVTAVNNMTRTIRPTAKY